MDELNTALVVLVPGAGAVAWLVTLHARVRQHSEQLLDLRTDVRYIRERIDRAIK
tara:strand:+ start:493 stop:657 length:165 start_codon:yes stop_codon:yes gene_type:complete